jgi:hypothetical protein
MPSNRKIFVSSYFEIILNIMLVTYLKLLSHNFPGCPEKEARNLSIGDNPVENRIGLLLISVCMYVCMNVGRSQWPRGLKHEPSLLGRTLGSWVRIPLKAWMSVCVYSVFVLF